MLQVSIFYHNDESIKCLSEKGNHFKPAIGRDLSSEGGPQRKKNAVPGWNGM
jgi:hypothetical protein